MDDKSSNSGASSSDFVRKLYKMLEDPSYDSVVRWGNDGDSFVVLENEKFTKHILPKHFKHSNFASFVRQLNKYDFHKVRHNNEENVQTQYGPGAWEFKHPDFKANNKDALDNIRRKAPVPRKANQLADEPTPTPQMDLVNGQLVATQQQLQSLQDRYNDLSMHHATLLQEVIGLQKTVVNHEHVIQNVMSFLHTLDTQRRRESRVINPFAQGTTTNGTPSAADQIGPLDDDDVATPLAHADKLLAELSAEVVLNSKTLEHMNEVSMRLNGTLSTPPPSETTFRNGMRPASRQGPQSAASSTTMRFGELENVVYPVGQTQGIDPMYSEHIHNIPYPMPSKPPPEPKVEPRKKNTMDPGWLRQPQILLVEDDPTCRRIGGKFLYAFSCAIDYALDGLEAVNKMNAGSKYDLVLMDIIMPNLDGVSACHLIRQFDSTPIVAMTSNIRSDDISMYFQHGMNDVLPKPFTKEGLLSMLEKHLSHLKKQGAGMEATPIQTAVPTTTSHLSNPHTHTSSRQSLKDENSPGASPATVSTNWNSPLQTSPVATGMSPDEYMHAVRQPVGYGTIDNSALGHHPPGHYGPASTAAMQAQRGPSVPHRRNISDISGGEDMKPDVKRQMYAPIPPMQAGRY